MKQKSFTLKRSLRIFCIFLFSKGESSSIYFHLFVKKSLNKKSNCMISGKKYCWFYSTHSCIETSWTFCIEVLEFFLICWLVVRLPSVSFPVRSLLSTITISISLPSKVESKSLKNGVVVLATSHVHNLNVDPGYRYCTGVIQ